MIRKVANFGSLKNGIIARVWHLGFSEKKQARKFVQTVGFKSKNIQNIRTLSYKPTRPIEYINGGYLIYKSKSSPIRTLRDYIWYLLGISCLCYMLYNRSYFDSNPVNKHLYIGGIFIRNLFLKKVFVGIARKFLRNHNVVKQMYLLEGGKATKIIFQNQFKRKLFGQITQNVYYNSLFFTPVQQKGETMWKPLNLFPQTIELLEEEAKSGFYWKKLYMNHDNFLLIPKDTQFIHPQILVEVMNGKIILN